MCEKHSGSHGEPVDDLDVVNSYSATMRLAVWAHNPVQTEQVSGNDGLAKLRLSHEGVDQV